MRNPHTESDPFYIGNPSYGALARTLQTYEPRSTLSQVAGLLTVPEFHPETLRIEMLLNLAALNCRGKKQPKLRELKRWLEEILGDHLIRFQEDPLEDVFISNVVGPGGNYRLFGGYWETGDYYIQHLIDCLTRTPLQQYGGETVPRVLALLRVSDLAAERSGLSRWESSPKTFPTQRFLGTPRLSELASRITFTFDDFRDAGVAPEDLNPFMLGPSDRPRIAMETLGNSSLERYPVVRFGQQMVLACPTAVSAAIRRYVLEVAHEAGWLDDFQSCLRLRQRRVLQDAVTHLCSRSSPFRGPLPPEASPANAVHAAFDIGHGAFDRDKLVQFVLLHDELDEIRQGGLVTYMDSPEGLGKFLNAAAGYYARRATSGMTILIRGGLGRGLQMEPPSLHPRWNLAVMSIADFEMFTWSEEASLLRLWKLRQLTGWLAKENVEVEAPFGILDEWAFWVQRKFELVDKRMMFPSSRHQAIFIPSDFRYDFRTHERKRFDHHAVSIYGGIAHAPVIRLEPNSYFLSRRDRPVYASRELTAAALLAGVVEGHRLTIWVESERPDASEHIMRFLYQLWEATLYWVDRIVQEFDIVLSRRLTPPLQIELSFADIEQWERFHDNAGTITAEEPHIQITPGEWNIEVAIPYGFTTFLARPTNDGERLLVSKLTSALEELITIADPEVEFDSESIVQRVVRNTSARSLHIFRAPNLLDQLHRDITPDPRFVQPEDQEFHEMGLGWSALGRKEASEEPHEITEPKRSSAVLNAAVEVLWRRLRGELEELNGPELVRAALSNNEAIAQDRGWWSRTASALSGLYADREDVVRVAARRESNRALAMQSGRILIEMSVATCKKEGGRLVSTAEFDRLLAAVASLLLLAADSSAIYGKLANPTIRIHPNGSIETDQEFAATVAANYSFESFGGTFRSAVADYARLYERRRGKRNEEGSDPFTEPALVAAFTTEYGITPAQLYEVLGELWDWAIEEGRAIIETTRGALAERLTDKRSLTADQADAVLRMLTLVPRERWDQAPAGFIERDWIPWHFRRRLSVVARPLVTFGETPGDTLLYGAEQVGVSISNLLEGIQMAWLPNEFFTSAEMKRLRGEITDRLGHQFAEDVATKLRDLGWIALTEVQMTQLGAPQKLGDLDVVAWRASDSRLLLIECKRLQPIRNMGEIVERLNQFKGHADDRLGRHMRRIEWIEKNVEQVRKRLRISEDVHVLHPLLVTNDEVPMRFTKDLALPPEQIVPVSLLETRFAAPQA